MPVVVWFPDPGMAVNDTDPFREMLGEFRAMIGLDAPEFKRCFGLRLPQEGDAIPGTDPLERLGECPAGEHIDQRVHICPFPVFQKMNGIHLYQIPRI